MPATLCVPISTPRTQRCTSIPTQPPISVSVLELAWHLERGGSAASQAATTERQPVTATPRGAVAAWGGGPHRAVMTFCTASSRPPGRHASCPGELSWTQGARVRRQQL